MKDVPFFLFNRKLLEWIGETPLFLLKKIITPIDFAKGKINDGANESGISAPQGAAAQPLSCVSLFNGDFEVVFPTTEN